MNRENAENRMVLERERERESYSLKTIVVLAYLNKRISSLTNGLHIIYRRIKVDMQLMHMKSVY